MVIGGWELMNLITTVIMTETPKVLILRKREEELDKRLE